MLDAIFGAQGFIPHGYCLRWDPWLLARYVASDALIGLAYYSIPVALIYFARRHPELKVNWIFVLFAAFIFACGTGHFVEILNVWYPAYELQAWVKVGTALISITTAGALWLLAPRASEELRFHWRARERMQVLNEELTASNEALAQSEELFRLTMQSAPIGQAIVGLDGNFRSVNRSLCEIVGYGEAELLKLRFQDITHPDDLDRDLAHVNEVMSGARHGYSMNKRYLHRSGRIVDVQLDVALLRDSEGRPVHFVAQIQDITQRVQEGRILEVRAYTDDLTTLPNRRAFFEEGRRLLARSQRQHEDVTLMMMDLDHFKTINDTYGHASGDRALRAIKEVLAPRLRTGDLFARLGGEEFALLLPNTSPQYSRFVAERIRESVARVDIAALDGRRMPMTTSIGLALIGPREALETAMERADQALYRAKTAGRNRVMEAPFDVTPSTVVEADAKDARLPLI